MPLLTVCPFNGSGIFSCLRGSKKAYSTYASRGTVREDDQVAGLRVCLKVRGRSSHPCRSLTASGVDSPCQRKVALFPCTTGLHVSRTLWIVRSGGVIW